jgi:sterol desaturase/sphingolipid hydroxylase (fatty acid hydroxylase superfamily)
MFDKNQVFEWIDTLLLSDKSLFLLCCLVFFALWQTISQAQKPINSQPLWQRSLNNILLMLIGWSLLKNLNPLWIAIQTSTHPLKNLWSVPSLFSWAISFLLLDYLTYWWHRFNHVSAFLWRFHAVHHSDLQVTLTTAFRFHFGELLLSALYRSFFVFLLQLPLEAVLYYEVILNIMNWFQHSAIHLNSKIEKWFNIILVTPRMHRVHHHIGPDMQSNYSSIFSLWDKIHQSYNSFSSDESKQIPYGLSTFQKEIRRFTDLILFPLRLDK